MPEAQKAAENPAPAVAAPAGQEVLAKARGLAGQDEEQLVFIKNKIAIRRVVAVARKLLAFESDR